MVFFSRNVKIQITHRHLGGRRVQWWDANVEWRGCWYSRQPEALKGRPSREVCRGSEDRGADGRQVGREGGEGNGRSKQRWDCGCASWRSSSDGAARRSHM